MVKPSSLIDFANQASEEIGKYIVHVTLSPEKLMKRPDGRALAWRSIPHGKDEIKRIPNKRGVYAFGIYQESDILPPHGYILYIGIAGKDSSRPLRERYKDYLNERKVLKRPRIAWMIGNWHKVLHFYFAPVDDSVSSEELKKLEKQLNTALMPPFSEGDLEADTKRKRRAFR